MGLGRSLGRVFPITFTQRPVHLYVQDLKEEVEELTRENSRLRTELDKVETVCVRAIFMENGMLFKFPSSFAAFGCILAHEHLFILRNVSLPRFHSQVGELSATLDAQSTMNEEYRRLKEEMEKAQEELVRMESQMIDSQLKEAEISQQHMETSELLTKVQADLEHLTAENNRLLTSLEEAMQNVS